MSAEKQLFMKLCTSITGQIWQLKGNLIFNHFNALDSYAISYKLALRCIIWTLCLKNSFIIEGDN